MPNDLKAETALFQANLEAWRKTHVWQVALIIGQDVVGFFPTLQAAFKMGTERFGVATFLVKQIVPLDPVNISLLGHSIRRTG